MTTKINLNQTELNVGSLNATNVVLVDTTSTVYNKTFSSSSYANGTPNNALLAGATSMSNPYITINVSDPDGAELAALFTSWATNGIPAGLVMNGTINMMGMSNYPLGANYTVNGVMNDFGNNWIIDIGSQTFWMMPGYEVDSLTFSGFTVTNTTSTDISVKLQSSFDTANTKANALKVEPITIGTVSSFANTTTVGSSASYTASDMTAVGSLWTTLQHGWSPFANVFAMNMSFNYPEDATLLNFAQNILPLTFTEGSKILLEGTSSGQTTAALYSVTANPYWHAGTSAVWFPGQYLEEVGGTWNDFTYYWTPGESSWVITGMKSVINAFYPNIMAPVQSAGQFSYMRYQYDASENTVLRVFNYDAANAYVSTQIPTAVGQASSLLLYVKNKTSGLVTKYTFIPNGTIVYGDGYYDIPVQFNESLGINTFLDLGMYGESSDYISILAPIGNASTTTYTMNLNTGTTVNKTNIAKLYKNNIDVTSTHLSVLTPNVSSGNIQYSSSTNYETLFAQGDTLKYLGSTFDLLSYANVAGNTIPVFYFDTSTDSIKLTGSDVTLQNTKNTLYTSCANTIFKSNIQSTTADSYFFDPASGDNTCLGQNASVGLNSQWGYVVGSTAIGARANSGSTLATAVGYDAHAGGIRSTALGWQSQAKGLDSTAIGGATIAYGDYSTSIGKGIYSGLNNYSTVVGSQHYLVDGSSQTVLLGSGVSVYNPWIQGIGINCQGPISGSHYSVAIGKYSWAKGAYSTCIGQWSFAGQQSVAVGYSAGADTTYGVAIGEYSRANYPYSVAIGDWTQSNTPMGTALGRNAIVSGGYCGVALGASAVSTAGATGIAFGYAYTNSNYRQQKIFLNYSSPAVASSGKRYLSAIGQAHSASAMGEVWMYNFGSPYDGQLYYGKTNVLLKASSTSYPNDWKIMEVNFALNYVAASSSWVLTSISSTTIANGGGANQSGWSVGFEIYNSSYLCFYLNRSDSISVGVSATVEMDQLTKSY